MRSGQRIIQRRRANRQACVWFEGRQHTRVRLHSSSREVLRFPSFVKNECRCALAPHALQMNVTSLIWQCGGRMRCPLLFVPPVWELPSSFPIAMVSPISQGSAFIRAPPLPPAASRHIPIISLRSATT